MWDALALVLFAAVVIIVYVAVSDRPLRTREDRRKLRAILRQVESNQRRLRQILEAEPPASTQSGEPPQG